MGVKSRGGCEAESVFQPSAHLTFLTQLKAPGARTDL